MATLGATAVYVDGSGGKASGYGYVVPETGESRVVDEPDLTNNQAEYMAILAALERYADPDSPLVIYSDSKVVVSQINREYAINKPALRDLARRVWSLAAGRGGVQIRWIPRRDNPAGKMLGS